VDYGGDRTLLHHLVGSEQYSGPQNLDSVLSSGQDQRMRGER
jgi:hypothetical protein